MKIERDYFLFKCREILHSVPLIVLLQPPDHNQDIDAYCAANFLHFTQQLESKTHELYLVFRSCNVYPSTKWNLHCKSNTNWWLYCLCLLCSHRQHLSALSTSTITLSVAQPHTHWALIPERSYAILTTMWYVNMWTALKSSIGHFHTVVQEASKLTHGVLQVVFFIYSDLQVTWNVG